MPKDPEQCHNVNSRKNRNVWHHPYSNLLPEGSTSRDGEINAQKKEWDDAMCPICMEHPHNAVLLLCSSYDKGCCPYMCDTSYRHSNCFDQYRKPRSNCQNNSSQSLEVFMDDAGSQVLSLRTSRNMDEVAGIVGAGNATAVAHDPWTSRSDGSEDLQNRSTRLLRENANGGETLLMNTQHHRNGTEFFLNDDIELKCPLCRGMVKGWKVVEAARQYLNMKARNCSHDSCSFSGTYEQLRKHARSVHPTARPADVDPSHQRAWRHLERQRDFGDVLSTIRSTMPRAVVLGDYVIDNEDIHFGRGDESDSLTSSRSWWTTFFLFHMMSPIASVADDRGFPARWRAARRQFISPGMLSVQPMLADHMVGTADGELESVSTNEAANGVAEPSRRRQSNRFRDSELP
uniref:Uncharacterized protein n=1 Tax=Araucaria cunninghamii TaxID=56994 RepID=A0A0D6R719_ARACU